MCGVEIISLRSTSCNYIQTAEHHVWQKYTYTLCPAGVARLSVCDNAVNGQTAVDNGSARIMDCPVCKKLQVAERECLETKRLADEEFARAYTAAFREETHIWPLESPSGPRRSRDGRERRGDDRQPPDRQHGNGGRGTRHDRDRHRSHDNSGGNYYDDSRGGALR